MTRVMQFLVIDGVGMELRARIRAFFKQEFKYVGCGPEHHKRYKALTPSLRHEVFCAMHMPLLSQSRLFRYMPSTDRRDLCAMVRTFTYASGDLVFQDGKDVIGISFMGSGTLEIRRSLTGGSYELQAPYAVGQHGLFFAEALIHPFDVHAKTICHLLALKYSAIMETCIVRPQLRSYLLQVSSLIMVRGGREFALDFGLVTADKWDASLGMFRNELSVGEGQRCVKRSSLLLAGAVRRGSGVAWRGSGVARRGNEASAHSIYKSVQNPFGRTSKSRSRNRFTSQDLSGFEQNSGTRAFRADPPPSDLLSATTGAVSVKGGLNVIVAESVSEGDNSHFKGGDNSHTTGLVVTM